MVDTQQNAATAGAGSQSVLDDALTHRSSIAEALQSPRPISGFTHQYYRYPAAFSPELVREVIRQYTSPDDYVLDPFAGGGTTIVEALAAGRPAIGFDLNALAVFIARVKTRPLSRRQWLALRTWAEEMDPPATGLAGLTDLPGAVGRVAGHAMAGMDALGSFEERAVARCALLRMGQWALESRKTPPDAAACCAKLATIAAAMETGMNELVAAAAEAGLAKTRLISARRVVHGSADAAATYDRALSGIDRRPRLVLTSPPYPRVHVLYSRWQVDGRRETSVPYEIAACKDGLPPSYYTLGPRTQLGEDAYFLRIARVFELLRNTIAPGGHLVQVVGFNRVETQLDRYVATLSNAGFAAEDVSGLDRRVPNRRWYARGTTSDSSREFLLVHRLRG